MRGGVLRSPIYNLMLNGPRCTNMMLMSLYFSWVTLKRVSRLAKLSISNCFKVCYPPRYSMSGSRLMHKIRPVRVYCINPLDLLHYRLRSDVLSSGTLVTALCVDVEYISCILHLREVGSPDSQTRAPSANRTLAARLYWSLLEGLSLDKAGSGSDRYVNVT